MSWIVMGEGLSNMPSWHPNELPEGVPAERYEVTDTGLTGVDSGRKRFSVRCVDCDRILHSATTGPNSHIKSHEEECHGK
jgi:hypothetical protein